MRPTETGEERTLRLLAKALCEQGGLTWADRFLQSHRDNHELDEFQRERA